MTNIPTLKDLNEQREMYVAQEKEAKKNKQLVEADIRKLFNATGDIGTQTESDDTGRVKFTTGKKVAYDQEGLAVMAGKIRSEWNESPEEYLVIKYDINETAYKNWPTVLQKEFEPYRTVSNGTTSLKIELNEGEDS